jgi:mRNA interferase MazF
VWWAEHPDERRRPVLILTRSEAIPVLHSLVVAPATRTIRSIPSEVVVGPDDGMPAECAISFENVSLMSKGMLTRMICRLGPDRLLDACRAMAAAFDC